MLKSLKILQFQSHGKTKLKLSPKVNVIVGPSDSGKSAIFRAVKWACGLGKEYITHGKKSCKVELNFSEGTTVIREKNGGKNKYVLNGEEFQGFGQKTPEDVKKALNISDINFHSQGRFLLDINSSQRAQYINKLINLQIIDEASKRANGELSKLQKNLKLEEKHLKENNEKLSELRWIEEAEGTVESLKHIEREISAVRSRSKAIFNILKEIEEIEEKKKAFENLPSIESIDKLLASSERVKNISARIKAIKEVLNDIFYVEKEMARCSKELKQIDMKLSKVNICPLCGSKINAKTNTGGRADGNICC